MRPRILAHHLIFSGYGFWLANEPRGSGSEAIRDHRFDAFGSVHLGRKRKQPTREELRDFYRRATPVLEHIPMWFDESKREIVAAAFANVTQRCGYTVWACFVGSNHAHICVRVHRDRDETQWTNFAAQARTDLVERGSATEHHPVWAKRPYAVFLDSVEDIEPTIAYIRDNAPKEGLLVQDWAFVAPYDSWPLHKKR